MSIITPATVISIQYKLPYAKYKYPCVTDSSIVSLFVEWPFVAYKSIKHILTFSHIPCKSVTTSAIYHGNYMGHCVYIFSTHMDTMWLFLLLIAIYINLVDLNDYTYIFKLTAFHYNKCNVHVFIFFVFVYNVSASHPMNCFVLRPISRKKFIS